MQKTPKQKAAAAPPAKTKPGRKGKPSASGLKHLLPLLFILPVVFAAYIPALNNDLTNWDDPDLIIDNPLIRELSMENLKQMFTTFYFGNYQPLHLLSYAIEYHFWELNPTGYHAVSLALFLVATVLIYFFTYILSGKKPMVAAIATLLFAVNAMRVESVAWAAERKDMLYAVFYMASLLAYLRYVSGEREGGGMKWKFLLYAFLFFVLAVFSKVMAVSIVGPMVFLDYYYGRKLTLRPVLEKLPFVALSIVVGLVQVAATASTGTIDESGSFSLVDRILIVCRNLVFYLYKTLVPVNLSAFHPYPARLPGDPWPLEFYMAPFIVALLLALVAWAFLRRRRVIVFVAGFYVAALALVLQFVAIGPSMFNERYSLIPSVALSFGLACGIMWLAERYPSMKKVFLGTTAAYLVVMFVLTWNRCEVWNNSLTLWDDALAQYPNASMALNNRGKFYGKDLGNTTKAMEDLTRAIRYNTNFEQPYSNRGIVYCLNGKFDSAIEDFNKAISIRKDYYEAISNRGIAYSQTGRPGMAVRDFSRCLELEPGKFEPYVHRGFCYLQLNRPDSALADFNAALTHNPGLPDLYLRRSQALYYLRNYKAALADAETARASGVNVDENYMRLLRDMAKR